MTDMDGQIGFGLDRSFIVIRYPGFSMDQLDVLLLGRIGHLLRHPGFYEDHLALSYTGPDRSFVAPSGLFTS